MGDLATRNAAIAREESVTGGDPGGGDAAEGMRQVQAELGELGSSRSEKIILVKSSRRRRIFK